MRVLVRNVRSRDRVEQGSASAPNEVPRESSIPPVILNDLGHLSHRPGHRRRQGIALRSRLLASRNARSASAHAPPRQTVVRYSRRTEAAAAPSVTAGGASGSHAWWSAGRCSIRCGVVRVRVGARLWSKRFTPPAFVCNDANIRPVSARAKFSTVTRTVIRSPSAFAIKQLRNNGSAAPDRASIALKENSPDVSSV